MEDFNIQVQPRTELGSTAMRRIRKLGFAPAVVYSGGEPAESVSVNAHQFQLAARGKRPTQIFTLSSEDKQLDGKKVFIKSVQFEPLKDRILHVDFLSIRAGQKVVLEVPVEITGEPPEVKSGACVLEQRAYSVSVECLPEKIPGVLTVDVSGLTEGDSIHAGELPLPDGVALRTNEEQVVVIISSAVLTVDAPATPAADAAAATPAAATPAKATPAK